ncbi:MAG TPA: SIMPL domain-containing protein [Gemmatimonadales bacterium]|nr:SIMPL domain-containing protein [Gemmatimonadales bacterium]
MAANGRSAVPAVILALGIALGGLFIGNGFATGRAADQYVEVKGLAEREVPADLALWPLRYVSTGDDLAATQAQITRHTRQVFAFLARNAIDTSSVQLQGIEVSDAFANRFPGERAGPRYVIQQTVMVRSHKPEVVLAASQRVSELVGAGVVLSSSSEFGIGGPTFLFTRLNQLKPSMVKEATANARAAAEQFAADSRTELGGIRHANQGVFVILPRDQAPGVNEGGQLHKVVRVVSTIQYFLE